MTPFYSLPVGHAIYFSFVYMKCVITQKKEKIVLKKTKNYNISCPVSVLFK